MSDISIELEGVAEEIRFSLQFDCDLESQKDWILTVVARCGGRALNYDTLNWSYSSSLDRNFIYLPSTGANEAFLAPTLVGRDAFDQLQLELIPWTKAARGMKERPRIKALRYAVKHEHLTGRDVDDRVNVLGLVQPLEHKK